MTKLTKKELKKIVRNYIYYNSSADDTIKRVSAEIENEFNKKDVEFVILSDGFHSTFQWIIGKNSPITWDEYNSNYQKNISKTGGVFVNKCDWDEEGIPVFRKRRISSYL